MRYDNTLRSEISGSSSSWASYWASIWQVFSSLLTQLVYCRRAAIAPLTALMLVPISGGLALAVELGSWNYMQRSMQNAADSAALAAASVNSGTATTGTTSQNEARAAAKQYGYTDGVGGTTVTSATIACPTTGLPAGSTCYHATIDTTFPLLFSRILGFTGSGGGGQLISSRAIAVTAGGSAGSSQFACVYAITFLQANGTPNADLTGCSVMSGGGMDCNGNGLTADFALAANTVTGPCSSITSPTNHNMSNQTIPPDPYAALASNIPVTTCGTNPATTGNLSATLLVYCGNVTLSGNVTLTSPNTVVVIKNGTLDLNNKILKTATGASATIIFDGSAAPFGDDKMRGTIDIQAPPSTSTSVWKGVAVYRKPGGPTVSATLAGSKATWSITGLVYLPKTNVTLSGAVNHSATGATCFVLVGDNITINGNGQILQTTAGCNTAGLTPPSLVVGGGTLTRERLVK
ncbi:MAG: pilus assembly protein TadG-related protein [Novosphingobium sp.]